MAYPYPDNQVHTKPHRGWLALGPLNRVAHLFLWVLVLLGPQTGQVQWQWLPLFPYIFFSMCRTFVKESFLALSVMESP